MDKLQPPLKALPYIEALRELIRTGATASPALESSILIDLPAIKHRVRSDASPAKRAHIFITLLRRVAVERLEGKDAKTALILFGFGDYSGVPLQDRYRTVAKLYNRYWTWENYRKEPLTRHLLAVYLALEREAEFPPALPHFGTTPIESQSGTIGQDWVMEYFDSTYNFPEKPGQPLEIVQKRRLRATSKSIDFWRHRLHWRERGAKGRPHLSLFGPGTISIIDDQLDPVSNVRVFIIELKFPKAIQYGESIEFILSRTLPVDYSQLLPNAGKDWFGFHTLASPAEYVRIALRFPAKQPRHIWYYQGIISGLMRPGSPTRDTVLTVDFSGFVSHTWTDAPAGLSYGISFEW